jgi:hypothetical protein
MDQQLDESHEERPLKTVNLICLFFRKKRGKRLWPPLVKMNIRMRQIAFWRIKAKLLFNLAPKAMSPCLEEGEKEFFKERKGRAANEHPTRRKDARFASALIRLTRWDVISEADSWKSPRQLMPGASRGCSIEEVT